MTDRRKYSRVETKIEATIILSDLKISATMTDIGIGGIGLLSEIPLQIGTEVFVVLKLKSSYAIKGSIIWSSQVYSQGKIFYQNGLRPEGIILPKIKAIGLLEHSKVIEQILFKMKYQVNPQK